MAANHTACEDRHRDKRELAERNQRMASMRHNGMTLREISAVFGVSKVRVHQVCRREEGRQQAEMGTMRPVPGHGTRSASAETMMERDPLFPAAGRE